MPDIICSRGNNMFKKITRKNLEQFLSHHASEKRTLDIGSGGSLYGYERFFPNRVTVDIDPARNPEIIGDIHALPFTDGEFDMVLCIEVLEHVLNPRKAMEEMRRVLKKGGTLILTTRFVYPIHDAPNDYWRFTKYGLQELVREWKMIELIPETKTFSALAVLFQRIAYQTKLRFNAPAKLKLFFFAFVFNHLNWLIQKEYGDIKKSTTETDILSSGYYLVCKKR